MAIFQKLNKKLVKWLWLNRGLLLIEMAAYSMALESFKQAMAIHLDPRYLHASQGIWLKKKLFVT